MYEYKATIVNVVDGDTFDAIVDVGFHLTAKLRFRMTGIDTPEVVGATKADGLAASAYVKQQLLGTKVVLLTEKTDVFGRWLATVIIENTNFNQHLVDLGLAKPFRQS